MSDLPTLRVLLVEDERTTALIIREALESSAGLRVRVVGTGAEALAALSEAPYAAVICDVGLPDGSGIDLIPRIHESDPDIPVILITALGTVERALDGFHAGATDFLVKPVDPRVLVARLARALAERGRQRLEEPRASAASPATVGEWIVGSHPRLAAIRERISRAANAPWAHLLITGERGTGKRRVARAIHHLSGAAGPFVELNLLAIPTSEIERDLFGQEPERGEGFGAGRGLRRGVLEAGSGGTVLLERIEQLPPRLQDRLLLALEERAFLRVGGTKAIPLEARVIATSTRDPERAVREGSFHPDLYDRLATIRFVLPPLREIPEVIPELASLFLTELCLEFRRPLPPVHPESRALLAGHGWPGNARELRNALERALIFHDSGALQVPVSGAAPRSSGEFWSAEDDPETTRSGSDDLPEDEGGREAVVLPPGLTLDEVERRYVEMALAGRDRGADLTSLARALGISRKTLWEKRRRWDLD